MDYGLRAGIPYSLCWFSVIYCRRTFQMKYNWKTNIPWNIPFASPHNLLHNTTCISVGDMSKVAIDRNFIYRTKYFVAVGHVALVAMIGISYIYFIIQSLQIIWSLGPRRWHLLVRDLQISCSPGQRCYDIGIWVPAIATRGPSYYKDVVLPVHVYGYPCWR